MEISKRALVVGVNKYSDASIKDLEGAVNDATEVRDALVKHGGFEIDDDHFLPDDCATSDAIRAAISDLLWRTDKCDLTAVYFSGHGFQDSYGTGFFAPHDMIKDQPIVRGIPMKEVKQLALGRANKASAVLIFDCCFSGVAAQGDRDAPIAMNTADLAFGDIEEPADVGAQGTIILTSSSVDQTSRESADFQHSLGDDPPHPHGAFTFHLLEGLAGRAQTDAQGGVSIGAVSSYIENAFAGDPKQTFTQYGAAVSNASGVILATASQLGEIESGLSEAESLLNTNELSVLITGARRLSSVVKVSPKFPAALKLVEAYDARLVNCKKTTASWIVANKMEILTYAPNVLLQLEEIVDTLCVQRIGELDNELAGLLASLVQTVDGSLERQNLISYLMIHRSSANRTGPRPTGQRATR